MTYIQQNLQELNHAITNNQYFLAEIIRQKLVKSGVSGQLRIWE